MTSKIKSVKIRIGDISISYFIKTQENTRKTIVFLHGFPFNKNMWRAQLDSLGDDVTGIAIDIRGHGNTTKGHGFFSIDVFAKDLGAFIKKLDLQNIVLCGVSMGGYICLRAYELFPEKISGLILSDTHSKADNDQQKQKRFDSIQAILDHGRRPFAIGFIDNVLSPKTVEQFPEKVELIKSSIRRNQLSSICLTHLALAARTDTTAVLEKIDKPVLLIRGIEDKITPEEAMLDLHKAIRGSKFVQIANSGHLPNLENETSFNTYMNKFLDN